MSPLRRFIILSTALLFSACAGISTAPPDTSATAHLNEWLRVFNKGNDSLLDQYVETAFVPGPKRLLRQRVAREMSERYELLKINESSQTRVVAELAASGTDQHFGVTLEVDPTSNRVTRFFLSRLSTQLGEAEAVRRGKRYVSALASRNEFSGVVLLSRNGSAVFEESYGMADRESKIPVDAATRFSSASVGKMFTAVAILQLVQAGRVDLNAPIALYLPDFPNATFAQQATVHQLLSHTSGMGDIDWPSTRADHLRQLQMRTLSDYITRYGSRDPRFAPGKGWAYSNLGYVTLGRIIETVSGQDYYAYVSEHVFAAAGMTDAGFPTADDLQTRMAVPYTRVENDWKAIRTKSFYRAMPAGGATVTARDLVKFGAALLEHRLLDAHHTELLTVGKTEVERGGIYAYGLLDERSRGGAWFGHSGGAPGISTEIRIFPWSGYVVAVLSNLDPPVTENIAQELVDWLPR